jgi:hypothetical protein
MMSLFGTGITEVQKREGSSTVYKIEGEAKWVDHRVTDIMDAYPPDGYGTHVVSSEEPRFGRKSVVVKRSNSCD